MKSTNLPLVIALLAGAVAPAHAATLTFEISNVRASDAPLYVSVQKREEFMQDGAAYGAVLRETQAGMMRVRIENVAPGEYAPTVWHDDNANGTFDTGEDHMPLDGWSMVGAGSMTGEPNFDEARIIVGSDDVTVPLAMIYGR